MLLYEFLSTMVGLCLDITVLRADVSIPANIPVKSTLADHADEFRRVAFALFVPVLLLFDEFLDELRNLLLYLLQLIIIPTHSTKRGIPSVLSHPAFRTNAIIVSVRNHVACHGCHYERHEKVDCW